MKYWVLLLYALAGVSLASARSQEIPRATQPLVFEPNRGQAPAEAKWIGHGPGYELIFTDDGMKMIVADQSTPSQSPLSSVRKCSVIQLKLDGSRPWNSVSGLEPTGGVSNYLHGHDAKALTGIPHYARLRVPDVYEGIDLVFYNNAGNLEYDFELRPGADPAKIKMSFEGQSDLRVDGQSGDLVLTTRVGSSLRQRHPKIYQQAGDRLVDVAGGYKLAGGHVAFAVGSFDPGRPLVIDPTLQIAEPLGNGSGANAIAVDAGGNVYLTGWAYDSYPTTNGTRYTDGVDTTFWDNFFPSLEYFFTHIPDGFSVPVEKTDVVVTKLNPAGTILFSSYTDIGLGTGIAVDSDGIVVTGWRTPDQHDEIQSPTGLFVAKLSLTGSLIYESILAATQNDVGSAIALDSQHNAWVAGQTFAHANKRTDSDAIALSLNPQGKVTSSETFAGSGNDAAYAVAVDGDDNPWFTGQTCSTDFPATPGFNYFRVGKCAIFALKLIHQVGAATTKFVTVFGGGDNDAGQAIAVNANREAYVTGSTKSVLLYTSPGAYQTYPTGYGEGFVTHIDGFGNYLHSTLLGSSGDTSFSAIALNGAGEVYVGGNTTASSFPQNGPVVPDPTTGIIAKLTPDLTDLLYSRQLGVQINGLAVHEIMPIASPAQIYTAGSNFNGDLYYGKLLDDLQYTRIRNHWQTNEYINIQSRVPAAGTVGPGWLSAQWTFELQPVTNGDPVNTPVFWIHNRWQPDASGEYLNIESGSLLSSTIGPGWLSARWFMQPIPATNLYRICNVWKPDLCLNVESGTLQASEVGPGWWSAMWSFERVEQ